MTTLKICLALLTIGLLIYKWSTATFKTFEKRGLCFEKPYPLVGNMAGSALQRDSFQKDFSDLVPR